VTCGAIGWPVVEIEMRRIYLKRLNVLDPTQGTRGDFRTVQDA
jgi:hypothetical protein